MEYIKTRRDFLFTLNPLFILIGILLIWFYPKVIFMSFYVFWIALIASILLFITPLGKKKLTPPDAEVIRFPILIWLILIFILELSLLGMYFGIAHLTGVWFSINSAPHDQLFVQTMPLYFINFGLFPWTVYAILTVSMGALAYRKQSNAYFSNLLKPFFHQHPQEPLSLVANVGVRRCLIFVFAVSLMFLTLLFISFVYQTDMHLAHRFTPAALITTLFLIAITFFKPAKNIINRLFARRIPTALGIPMFCLILAALIIFLSATAFGLTQNNTTLQAIPDFIQKAIQKNWVENWFILSALWWLCLAPAICSFFTRISIGYRIRDVIAGILILPFLITVLYVLHHEMLFSWPIFSDNSIKIIALISFLIGLPLLLNHRRSSHVILAFFPKNGIEKPRDHVPFFQRIAQMTLISFYFYLTIGINGLNIYFFSMTYLIIIGLWIMLLSVFKNIQ